MGGMNKKMLVLLTSVGLLCGIAVGGLLWRQTERSPATIAAPSVPERPAASMTPNQSEAPQAARAHGQASQRALEHTIAQMHGKMATLQAELAAVRRDQAAVARRRAEAAASRTPDRPEPVVTAGEAQRQAEAWVQAQTDVIEDTFSKEQADSAWAPTAELALREVFQHDDVEALALVEAECRATMCRLEMAGSHAPTGDTTFEESYRKLIHLLPWAGQGFGRIDNAEGKAPTAVLYLTREGQVFPLVAEQ